MEVPLLVIVLIARLAVDPALLPRPVAMGKGIRRIAGLSEDVGLQL